MSQQIGYQIFLITCMFSTNFYDKNNPFQEEENFQNSNLFKDFIEYRIRKNESLCSYLNFEQDFHSILEWVCVLSLRYNIICREHTGEQENLYNHICVEITKGCKIDDIKKKLLTLYPSDEKFLEEFSEKVMPTKHSNKKARYLLARLEEFESNNTIDEADLTVEHILPLNPEEQWIDCFGNDWGQYNQRLGNMALLPSKENLAQELFEQKKEILLKSQYSINRNIENNSEWSIAEINARQKKIS